MRVELVKEFTFEALRKLSNAPQGDAFASSHSHDFRVAVTVEGEVDLRSQTGTLIDYEEIQKVTKPLLDQYLDHASLNEVEGLASPTSEDLANWIWQQLKGRLTGLKRITLRETCGVGCQNKELRTPPVFPSP